MFNYDTANNRHKDTDNRYNRLQMILLITGIKIRITVVYDTVDNRFTYDTVVIRFTYDTADNRDKDTDNRDTSSDSHIHGLGGHVLI